MFAVAEQMLAPELFIQYEVTPGNDNSRAYEALSADTYPKDFPETKSRKRWIPLDHILSSDK